MPILRYGRRRLVKGMPGGFSVQPALIPSLPLFLQSGYSPFGSFLPVIFVKKSEYHNYVHNYDAICGDNTNTRRCISSCREYGFRPRISGYDKNLIPDC